MSRSIYPPLRGFWVLCEINIVDHAPYINMPCHDLFVGINYYNDSTTINDLGGTFGCFSTASPEVLPDSACVPDYEQDKKLADCLSCTHMGVCIMEPPKPEV
jgi:hypothetical protein